MEVGPPSVDGAPRHVSVGHDDLEYPKSQFDQNLVWFYGHLGNGRPSLPSRTPMYNKYVDGAPLNHEPFCLRNIRVGKPAIADRLHFGEVVRFQTRTFAYNVGGRITNTYDFAVRVWGGHHEGKNCFTPGDTVVLLLPSYCRIVCIDTRKLKWCSVDSVVSHSFVWPKTVREAKSIARTLYTNRCNWADVLIVRGRCFSSSKVSFRANRVLENLRWNLSSMRRPYVVFTEGKYGTLCVDLVPVWLKRGCVYLGFCQCHLVGLQHIGWHRHGSLYSNVISHGYQTFEGHIGDVCKQRPFPDGCAKNAMNIEIATKLSRVVIHALRDTPPSVPQRGEPLVSVLRTKELKPKWGRDRFRKHKKWLTRFKERLGRCDRSRCSESYEEECSVEESIE